MIFQKYKRLFLIFGFILLTFSLGYLIFKMFLGASITSEPTPDESLSTSTPGKLPIAQEGQAPIISENENSSKNFPQTSIIPKTKISEIAKGGATKTTALTDSPTIGMKLDQNGSSIKYYEKNSGKFYKLSKNGEKVLLSEKVFHNVQNVTWSPTEGKAVLEYPDGANIVYDFDSEKQVTLPAHWESFDFSPQGDQLVFKSLGKDPDNRWLAVASVNGSKTKIIESIGNNDNLVYDKWSPNNQIIAMHTEGKDFDRQEVYFIGLNEENFKSTIIDGRGFQPKWSPVGDRLLYSVYSSENQMKPNLWIVNAQGEAIGSGKRNLNLETWAEKCAFADNIIVYCAVPENLAEGAGLFPELAVNTKDALYQINTSTGSKKLIAIPDGNFNITNITSDKDERYLYFTDSKTEQIHQVKLK